MKAGAAAAAVAINLRQSAYGKASMVPHQRVLMYLASS